MTPQYKDILNSLRKKLGDLVALVEQFVILEAQMDVKIRGVPSHPEFNGKYGQIVCPSPIEGHYVVDIDSCYHVICLLYLYPKIPKYTEEIRLGELVRINSSPSKCGWIEWISWNGLHYDLGVKLSTHRVGTCDGTRNGVRLFKCDPGRGLFCSSADEITHVFRMNERGYLEKIRYHLKHTSEVSTARPCPGNDTYSSSCREEIRKLFSSEQIKPILREHYHAVSSPQGLRKSDFIRFCENLGFSSKDLGYCWKYIVGSGSYFMKFEDHTAFIFQLFIEDILDKVRNSISDATNVFDLKLHVRARGSEEPSNENVAKIQNRQIEAAEEAHGKLRIFLRNYLARELQE